MKVYYTDDWKPYASSRQNSWFRRKLRHTAFNNCQMRHWFGRFKRKSIIVSKSVEMVNATIALFARFRVNGDVFEILKIAQMEPKIIIYSRFQNYLHTLHRRGYLAYRGTKVCMYF